MSQVKVKIDVAEGTIEVEAPAESYAEVFDKISEVLPQLVRAHSNPIAQSAVGVANGAENEGSDEGSKKKGARAGRGGSKETYKVVDLGVDEGERSALRDFFKEKKPPAQHDQIAVLMAWLKAEKAKSTMNKDEVYTAFRTVDAKVPAKISSVLGNMVGMGWVTNVGSSTYALTHVGEDHVKFDLPPKKKAK